MAKNKKYKKRTKKAEAPVVKAKRVKQSMIESINSPFNLKTDWIPILVLSILVFALYIKCLPYDYVLDDKIVITDNQFTTSGADGIWKILSTDSFQGYFGEQKDIVFGSRYRPLSIVSFALEYEFFGLNKEISHFINILLYLICCLLVYRLMKFFFKPSNDKYQLLWFGFIVSLIYMLHPLHVEAVANIKGRDEIMAMIGSLIALIYALKYQAEKKPIYLLFLSLGFMFGIFSKETTLTFLAVIPITLYMRQSKIDKALWTTVGLLVVLSAIYLFIRYSIIGYLYNPGSASQDLMNNPFVEMNSSEKWATLVFTTGQYIKLCLFPHPLTHDYYPYHIPIMDWAKPSVLIYFVIILAMILGSVYGFFKKKMLAYGIIFFLITLTIVSNVFVNVGTFMNERFAFMPSLGIVMFLIMALMALDQKSFKNPKWIYLFSLAIALGYFYKSWDRIPAWENTFILNSEAIKVSKNSARLNSFMSTAIYNKAKEMTDRDEKYKILNEGLVYTKKAVDIYPRYGNGHLMRAGIAADIYKIDNKLDDFLREFKAAAAVRPDIPFITEYCEYINDRSNVDIQKLSRFYFELGYQELFQKRRNARWAIHYLQLGRSIATDDKNINLALSEVYASIGDRQNSEQYKLYGTK